MRDIKQSIWKLAFQETDIGSHRVISNTKDCVVIRLENESGEGDMIIYQIFDGVYLMYNDFHMEYCESKFQTVETMLAVDYCREGSLQMKCSNGACYVKKSKNVCIDSRTHHKGTMCFPSGHFHGITIGFESDRAEKSLQEQVKAIPINLNSLREKFCGKDNPFIINEDENLQHLFLCLYQVPEKSRIGYFRTKVLELLVYLDAVEIEDVENEKIYFYKGQIEKVKAIQKLITKNIDKNYTIKILAENFDISQTALKKCFRNIYGMPIYRYVKKQRIQKAAELIKENRALSIGDIAYAVGYESGGKFAAAFRKEIGVTPSEYRKQPY